MHLAFSSSYLGGCSISVYEKPISFSLAALTVSHCMAVVREKTGRLKWA